MDAMDWTPGEACREAGEYCDEEDIDAVFICLLKRGDGAHYDTGFRNAGLSMSEAVALLEIMKQKMICFEILELNNES